MTTPRSRGWLDLALLAAFVAACYGSRLTDLSIRGEESRWATVALEMRRNGDWIVPRQQGEPFLSRPPMGSWLIALAAALRGACDPAAVRLPSLLAILATTVLIYGYGRSFLGRVGAVGAAAGFAAMPEILQMGRLAESDAVFTFFLASALIVWHWGMRRGWPDAATWGLGYLLAAAATLTKGPQAPAYFVGATALYLIAHGQWRRLAAPGHLLGLLVYAAGVGAWAVPFGVEMGWASTWTIIMGDSTDRFVNLSGWAIVRHLIVYPLEVAGCTAPWSWLLVAFASRRFRRSLADASPHAGFLGLCLLVSFPTCWITPGGQTRYLMPLYPCVALLAGTVIDRLTTPSPRLAQALLALRSLTVLSMLGTAGAIVALTWVVSDARLSPWRQPPHFAAAFAAAALLGAAAAWRHGLFAPRTRVAGIAALAVFLGAAYSGAVVNQLAARSEHAAEQVAALTSQVPAEERLLSLGPVHHKFAYEFGRPIGMIADAQAVPPGGWFCYVSIGGQRRTFGVACIEMAAISMDRHSSPSPQVQMVIVRRAGESGPRQLARRQP